MLQSYRVQPGKRVFDGSYELYKHFRDHTPGFEALAAFQASDEIQFGVWRSGDSEPAQSPGDVAHSSFSGQFDFADRSFAVGVAFSPSVSLIRPARREY